MIECYHCAIYACGVENDGVQTATVHVFAMVRMYFSAQTNYLGMSPIWDKLSTCTHQGLSLVDPIPRGLCLLLHS